MMTFAAFIALTVMMFEPFFNVALHVTLVPAVVHLTVFFVAPVNVMVYVRAPVTFLKVPVKVFFAEL
jgi:hypothetical protein